MPKIRTGGIYTRSLGTQKLIFFERNRTNTEKLSPVIMWHEEELGSGGRRKSESESKSESRREIARHTNIDGWTDGWMCLLACSFCGYKAETSFPFTESSSNRVQAPYIMPRRMGWPPRKAPVWPKGPPSNTQITFPSATKERQSENVSESVGERIFETKKMTLLGLDSSNNVAHHEMSGCQGTNGGHLYIYRCIYHIYSICRGKN